MAGYVHRTPPIQVVVDKNYFNMVIQALVITERNETDDKLKEEVKKLREKMLTYSVPREEDGETVIDMRFFTNEASILINKLMLLFGQKIEVEADYFEVLKKIRASRKENNQ